MTSPYWLLPAFLLLSFQLRVADTLSFHAALACVPLAALAGDRHGWRGVGMVVVGGLLLPFGLFMLAGGFPAEPGLYLVAIALAALLAARWPMPDLSGGFRPGFGFLAALVLLPLHVMVARERLDSGLDVMVIVSLLPLLFFLLFLLGWAQAPAPPVLGPLGLATAAGIALAMLDGTVLDLPGRLHYRLDSPADFLTGAACFLAGRYGHTLLEERTSGTALPRWPLATLALLLVLWGGYPAWHALVTLAGERGDLIQSLAPVGSNLALPLAALLAGWRYRRRGILGVMAIAAAVEVAGVLLAWSSANLGTLVVAFAFGALGHGLRDRRDGTRTPWPSGSWFGLALVGAVSLPLILGLEVDEPRDLLVLALALATILVLPFALRALLRRAGLWLSDAARRGWLAVTGLVLLVLGLLPHLKEALAAVGAVAAMVWFGMLGLGEGSGWRSGEALMMGIGVLFYLAMLLTALAALLARLPAVLDSGRELIRWLRPRRQPGHPMATDGIRETVETPTDAMAWLPRLARWVGWVRNGLVLIAVVVTLLLLMDEFW
ncbi:hypothetical protein BOX17_13650 [Halomonas aestuarii]|uniref:Uncharacterized protein n=2 Tax=Halomonas aestuarii TaxID=1897729 RepID=A0A1J0VIR3_9GAMM|nr:hypothetical protein BOX17_13650 [Halomonas aestuarii]